MTEISIRSAFVHETERNARAIIAHLSPLVGARPSGAARVVATGAPVLLPPNTYAIPEENKDEKRRWLCKVAFNPDTARAHWQGGEWQVTNAGADVSFVGNVGGEWQVPPGSKLRFSPPVPGLAPTATVIAPGIRGGDLSGGIATNVVFYDEFDQSEETEWFRSIASTGPAIVVGYIQSFPVEGRAGRSPGKARGGGAKRRYFKDWVAICLSGKQTSFAARHADVVTMSEAVEAMLDMRVSNDDGERMTASPEGVLVQQSLRLAPDKKNLKAWRVLFRTMSGRGRIDGRVFSPWLWTRFRGFAEEAPPALPAELDLFDVTDPMPQE